MISTLNPQVLELQVKVAELEGALWMRGRELEMCKGRLERAQALIGDDRFMSPQIEYLCDLYRGCMSEPGASTRWIIEACLCDFLDRMDVSVWDGDVDVVEKVAGPESGVGRNPY